MNKQTFVDKFEFSEFSISKYPLKGKCKQSCFSNGYHRAGIIPIYSLLDGGASGDVCAEYCLECNKKFKQKYFIIKNQPNKINYE